MTPPLAQQAGTALFWKAIQHAGAKIIFLVRLVILARLLSPDDFGLLAIAMVVVDVLMRITDLGMIPALVQHPDANEQHYNAAWTVGMIRALLISAVAIIAAPLVAQLFAEPHALGMIRVLALRPVIEAAASIKIADLTRNLRFRPLTYVNLSEAVMNTVVAIVLAPSLGVWALVAGAMAGPTASLLLSYVVAPYRPRLTLAAATIRPLIRFGRWIFVTSLIVIAGDGLLRLVISRQFGAAELGLYFLAARFAFLPAVVVSEVIGGILFPLYARLQSNTQQVTQAFRSVLTGVSSLLVPVCAIIIALAPSLVQEVLGTHWSGAVPIIRLLALASTIGLLGETVVPMLRGIGQPGKVVVIEGVQAILRIGLLWVLADHFGVVGAALAWIPTSIVSQCMSVMFVRQILSQPFAGLGPPILTITTASSASAILAWGIDRLLPGIVGCTVAILLAIALTGLLLWASDHHFKLGLRADLLRVFPQVGRWTGLSPVGR